MPTPDRAGERATLIVRHVDDGAVLRSVRPQLNGAFQRVIRRGTRPQRLDAFQTIDLEMLARSDGDRAGDRLDVEHVARLAVVGRDTEPQPTPLADGEGVRAVVLAQHLT